MRLSSQSLFLLLFVLVARVSLAAADLKRKDQPLAAPTPTPAAVFRFYARDDKKSNDDDQVTIFQCTTKVIVEIPANGNKESAVTNEQVKCMPTAVPSASATATRQNKRVTVTQTSKATPTTASSSSSNEKNDGSSSSSGGSSSNGSSTNNNDDGSENKTDSSDDDNSDVSAFTESGSTSSPTGSVEDPNAPATGGDNNGSASASDPNNSGDSTSSDNNNTDTDNNSSSSTDDTENSSNSEDGSSTAAGDDTTTDASDNTSDSDDSITGAPNDHQNGAPSEESGAASDPNVRSETQAVEGNVSNKALGIGLGVGIGCVAAIGLAGLLVANKRRRDSQSSSSSSSSMDDPNVNTHWRPQSFMGVVASVVAKLPRSASLRSNRSKRDTAAGMAVGAGQGAIEDPSATLGRHPSNSSSRSAASQPPSLARVHEHPAEAMHEIDLRY